MEFQTRTFDSEIRFFNTFAEAKAYAATCSVWKISFTIPETNERIRLVKEHGNWIYEDINGVR